MVSHQVLESSNRHVVIEKSEVILLGLLLSELEGDWCWMVGNKILEGSN